MDDNRHKELFGLKLKDLMKLHNVSQEELSEQTGLSKVTLSKYMNGRAEPSYFNAKKIADVLECS